MKQQRPVGPCLGLISPRAYRVTERELWSNGTWRIIATTCANGVISPQYRLERGTTCVYVTFFDHAVNWSQAKKWGITADAIAAFDALAIPDYDREHTRHCAYWGDANDNPRKAQAVAALATEEAA